MWWQLLLGIPALMVSLEIIKALSPWPITGRAAPLIVIGLACAISYLPPRGHVVVTLDLAFPVPLLMRYLKLSSSYERARVYPGELISHVLVTWDRLAGGLRGMTGRRGADHETAGTMLPPNVGKRIPSL